MAQWRCSNGTEPHQLRAPAPRSRLERGAAIGDRPLHTRHLRRIPFRPVSRWHMGNQDLRTRGWTAAGKELSPQKNPHRVPWLPRTRAAAGPNMASSSVGKAKSFIRPFSVFRPSQADRKCKRSWAPQTTSRPQPAKRNLGQTEIAQEVGDRIRRRRSYFPSHTK